MLISLIVTATIGEPEKDPDLDDLDSDSEEDKSPKRTLSNDRTPLKNKVVKN